MRHPAIRKIACNVTRGFVLLAFALAAGCGPALTGKFRLVTLDGELVVVPPPYGEKSSSKPAAVAVPVPAQSRPGHFTGCSFQSRLFRVAAPSTRSRPWRVTLPSLNQWLEAERTDTFRKEFGDFLDKIETLETRNCMPAESARMLAEWMRESVPMKNDEALFYRYDIGPGQGFIDLEPQMKLGIERAVYGPNGKFAGTQAAAYELSRDSVGRLKFQSLPAPPAPDRLQARDPSTPDLTLAERVRGFPYYRLFYLGDFAPKESNYEAMLVGTRSRGRMEEVTAPLRRRTASICPQDSAAGPVDCHLFQGVVTVTAEIGVTVNGNPVFGVPGRTVSDALSALRLSDCLERRRGLRVERQYLLGYAPVTSAVGSGSILEAQVFAGDRITCSSHP